jgi:hypothetical protein
MSDMRSPGGGDEAVSEPPKLAVKVGRIFTVEEKDLDRLPNGKYDVVGQSTMFVVTDDEFEVLNDLRLRRVE